MHIQIHTSLKENGNIKMMKWFEKFSGRFYYVFVALYLNKMHRAFTQEKKYFSD